MPLSVATAPDVERRAPAVLALSADGSQLVAPHDGGLALDRRTLPVAGTPVAAAVLDGATWVIAASAGRHALHRFDAGGASLGAPSELGALGRSVAVMATRTGPRLAVIDGEPCLEAREADGQLAIEELGVRGTDRRVLLGARGVLERRCAVLGLRRSPAVSLGVPPDLGSTPIVGGALLFDGTAAAIELRGRSTGHVLIYDLVRGVVRSRIRIGEARGMAIAERAGLMVLGRGPHLAVLDLRKGRCIAERIVPAPVDAVAIDALGTRIVALDARGALHELRGNLTGGGTVAADDAAAREPAIDGGAPGAPQATPRPDGATDPDSEPEPAPACGARDQRPDPGEPRIDSDGHVDRESEPDGHTADHSEDELERVTGPARVPDRALSPDHEPGASERAAGAASLATGAPLLALRPRPSVPALPAELLEGFLDDAQAVVTGWCAVAAARARDSGRLAERRPAAVELAALLAPAQGLAADELAAARAGEAAAATRFDRWARVATPLAVLAGELALSPFAGAILLVAAAPYLWGELARAYGILAGDPARPLVDELLIAQILELDGGGRAELARELDGCAPLIRHGVIALGAGRRPFASLEVAPAVISRLAGVAPDAPGAGRVAFRTSELSFDAFHGPRDRIAAVLDELAAPVVEQRPPRVVLRGRAGYGRRTLAAVLAARAGRGLGLVELSRGAGAAARLRHDLLEAHLRGWIPCLSGLDALGTVPGAGNEASTDDAAAIHEVVALHPGPVFVRAGLDATLPLEPGYLSVELPELALAERRAVWADALARHGMATADAAELADRYSVGPGTANRHCAELAARPGGAAGDGIAARIDRVLRHERAERLAAIATRVDRLAGWDDLVLPADTTASVRELVARIRLRSQVLDAWGMTRVCSTGRGVTALLQGGPGTGKTLVAGVIARELGFDLYRVDLSRVTSKWLGETEKQLGKVFDAAEDGQCVLLFDEADSLFGKRTKIESSKDRYANLEVNYLLQRLDSFGGIAILTTNFGTAIDPAFQRRLALHLQFALPDADDRERLWRAHLPPTLPRRGDLELAALATRFQLSGGHIRNAALRAAYLAAGDRVPLTAAHLRRAVELEYSDRGKICFGGPLD